MAFHSFLSVPLKKIPCLNYSKCIRMSFFAWKGSNRSENTEHGGRNLQDGLFQIASQACHILVQVSLLELSHFHEFRTLE